MMDLFAIWPPLTCGDLLITDGAVARVVAVDTTLATITLLLDGRVETSGRHRSIDRVIRATQRDALDTLSGADIIAISGLYAGGRPWSLTDVWNAAEIDDITAFVEVVGLLVGECIECSACAAPGWAEDSHTDAGGDDLCGSCYESDYFTCEGCERVHHNDGLNSLGDTYYCERCFDRNAYWCEDCDEYDTESHDHHQSCECEAPHRRFLFPANGDGFVRNDTRLTVELPAGAIAKEGIKAIYEVALRVQAGAGVLPSWELWALIDELEPVWQTRKGNFTRRLSSALHKRGVSLPSLAMSEVGNIARQHTSDSAIWHVEFTRELNLDADEFVNEGSCWWGSHSVSRCAFKSWGGLGIRSYADAGSGYALGRAWVQPLDENLMPTHDAAGAHAYVVYNGYGALEGYTPARIIAHLSGRTYRKVEFSAGDQYVNSGGYLVADQATCDANAAVSFYYDPHDQLDASSIDRFKQEVMA